MSDRAGARLSVVVPTLDEERSLPALLERLRRAGPDGADEVVVADGGSRDGTLRAAREGGARVVRGEPVRGAQLAQGGREASGELLLFLHADCLPEDGALALVRAALLPRGTAATALRQRIDAPGLVYRAIERAADLRVRLLGIVYGDSALGVRRDVYAAVGGFRALPLFEDVDLSRRLRRAGRVVLVPGARVRVSARRWEQEGVLRRTAGNWMLTAAYLAGVDPRRLARRYRPGEAREP